MLPYVPEYMLNVVSDIRRGVMRRIFVGLSEVWLIFQFQRLKLRKFEMVLVVVGKT